MVLTVATSALLGVVAKMIAVALGIVDTIPLAGLRRRVHAWAAPSPRCGAGVDGAASPPAPCGYGWDLDDVSVPLVSTLGDVLTLPALWLAVGLDGVAFVTPVLARSARRARGRAVVVVSLRSPLEELPRIVRQSLPVLTIAGALSALAGVAVERQPRVRSPQHPALLVLARQLSSAAPVRSAGSCPGRLAPSCTSVSSSPPALPAASPRRDIAVTLGLALPVFLFDASAPTGSRSLFHHESPGLATMLAVTDAGRRARRRLRGRSSPYYGTIAAVPRRPRPRHLRRAGS